MSLLRNESSVGGGDDKGMQPFDLFKLSADEFVQALTAEDAVSSINRVGVGLCAGGQRGRGEVTTIQ